MLESPYLNGGGYMSRGVWNSYLIDALNALTDDKGYDVLDYISRLDYKLRTFELKQKCTEAETVMLIVGRNNASLSRAINILKKNTSIDFDAELSCLAFEGS
jgi:hypothetical protein